MEENGWTIEGKAKNSLDERLGDFDAVLQGPNGPVVVEWETGNISSSHRSMNKLTLLIKTRIISAGVLVVPSRRLYVYLTDRISNIQEIRPYFALWKSVPCREGVLEIVVIEQDAISNGIPQDSKGDGRPGYGLRLHEIVVLMRLNLTGFNAVNNLIRKIDFRPKPMAMFSLADCERRSTTSKGVEH